MYIFPGYINIVILILHIQYIDILYNYCHWHWYWHWHWHLWVDESKTCGMVSKAWVSSTQFGSKGGEKGGPINLLRYDMILRNVSHDFKT